MSFKQIISRTHQEHVDPYVLILAAGAMFNPAAIEMVGPENIRTIVFYDKEKRRLAFTFFKASLAGSYGFPPLAKTRKRRVALKTFFKHNKVLDGLKEEAYPLERLHETISGFEGSDVFVVNLAK